MDEELLFEEDNDREGEVDVLRKRPRPKSYAESSEEPVLTAKDVDEDSLPEDTVGISTESFFEYFKQHPDTILYLKDGFVEQNKIFRMRKSGQSYIKVQFSYSKYTKKRNRLVLRFFMHPTDINLAGAGTWIDCFVAVYTRHVTRSNTLILSDLISETSADENDDRRFKTFRIRSMHPGPQPQPQSKKKKHRVGVVAENVIDLTVSENRDFDIESRAKVLAAEHLARRDREVVRMAMAQVMEEERVKVRKRVEDAVYENLKNDPVFLEHVKERIMNDLSSDPAIVEEVKQRMMTKASVQNDVDVDRESMAEELLTLMH